MKIILTVVGVVVLFLTMLIMDLNNWSENAKPTTPPMAVLTLWDFKHKSDDITLGLYANLNECFEVANPMNEYFLKPVYENKEEVFIYMHCEEINN